MTFAILLYTFVAWLLVLLIPDKLMGIFTSDMEMVRLGTHSLKLYFFGFVDTVQARIDVAKCTVDAMLNWGALTNIAANKFTDDFYFANTIVPLITLPLTFI